MAAKSQTSTSILYYRNIPRKHFRKQPYPMRAPDSSGDGFVYRINIYEIYAKNPTLLLTENDSHNNQKPQNINTLNEIVKEIDQMPINHQNLNYKNPRIFWDRTKSMDISQEAGFNLLHEKEKTLCSKLRLTPSIYLKAKYNILKAAQKHKMEGKEFKKSDAQKAVNFNVNKASVLWNFFSQLKWV
ncbi:hypothetical protein RhiirA5_455258 [Rhizophagus irregularis]|uniref:SWIRM domain-containing protein n=3 Tax=Rhizophagus irregularis TaxID=588596 RepID=A0A2I1F4X6_9GLOM|nr:Fun19p [Rhizophagus irregularis DAOM 197198w]PKC01946.1 hypothetical protein RhiirA5_455258 [Rhizophagus irregularis]PKC65267.1 hypothetical protein RhiirA1_442394 [Rhizophagus irregularis]PKK62639.1 hypothetical protein RhiirC2_759323 [Rhizophagus irregularis]PKY29432.1 hypothetical protein RhiirB3_483615 [Rhizophagus irregularis]